MGSTPFMNGFNGVVFSVVSDVPVDSETFVVSGDFINFETSPAQSSIIFNHLAGSVFKDAHKGGFIYAWLQR